MKLEEAKQISKLTQELEDTEYTLDFLRQVVGGSEQYNVYLKADVATGPDAGRQYLHYFIEDGRWLTSLLNDCAQRRQQIRMKLGALGVEVQEK
jgi:hypothetical protein